MKVLLSLLVSFVGVLTFIEYVHMKAHQEYEKDVHGYVKTFCWKNEEVCESIVLY